MRLNGKNAVITGCGRGIGLEIAKRFLQEGAIVVGCDVNEKHIENATKLLSKYGKIKIFKCDVSRYEDVQNFIKKAIDFLGEDRINILVNNAGIAKHTKFEDLTPEIWNNTIAVNLTGQFNTCKAVIPTMIKQRNGVILNMSSVNGIFAEGEMIHYDVSKAGILLLTKGIAWEFAKYNIRSVSICPGIISTELVKESGMTDEAEKEFTKKIPLGRFGTVEEVANTYVFLASDEASYITGTEIIVDGGQMCHQ